MEILIYNELNFSKIPNFKKFTSYIEADDFKSADVKKVGDNLYRARLNIKDRLLFSIYKYNGKSYALLLEFIPNHDYANSRFLRQVSDIDEDKIPNVSTLNENDAVPLVYLNATHNSVNLLDKIISFDETQHKIFELNPPLVIIGSAGSGKTALTLEKMKQSIGNVLYVTQSAYLVKNSRDLYYANHYENEHQEVDFLSFQEFLEIIKIPHGKAIIYPVFKQWFSRNRQSQIKDAHKLFEEFRGVLTGSIIDKGYLSREDYLNLGVKQSIFLQEERETVYGLFEKYLQFLAENDLYDSNIISHEYLQHLTPRYDFIIVDEVQDLTNIQLYLILKSLHRSDDFILCGDSNQIVHPNFFSWSNVKSLFCKQDDLNTSEQMIRILNTNYRNAPQLTEIANRVLKIKNLRFGSIDKESHYLITSNGHNNGEVLFLQDNPKMLQELNSKTKTSTLFAVIVMSDDQKTLAREHFNTPLVFTIQEAKGLEYENIILYNFLSQEEARYREIASGVNLSDLEKDLKYSRGKDKTDKSGEVYKFYINALYVALTRAIKNLYWIETNSKQTFLDLLNLRDARESIALANQNSSLDAWRLEARKLELQGKKEQADLIRRDILKQKAPPWNVITRLYNLVYVVKNGENVYLGDKQDKLHLFEYALVYDDFATLDFLKMYDFKPATNIEKGLETLKKKHFLPYILKKTDSILKQVDQYGLEFRNTFNQTPLMAASWIGNAEIIKLLCEMGADRDAVDSHGLTAFQIALSQAIRNETYAKKNLSKIYDLLVPDSMSFEIDNKLVKIDNHRMDFFIINLMIAMFYKVKSTDFFDNFDNSDQLIYKNVERDSPLRDIPGFYCEFEDLKGFATQDILEALKHLPLSIFPQCRRNRSYLTSILSTNERDSNNKYNRKLFYRLKRGIYLFNPELFIMEHGNVRTNIYFSLSAVHIMRLFRIKYIMDDPSNENVEDLIDFAYLYTGVTRF